MAMNQKSRHLWTRLRGRRAFSELSGSAELAEDRAVAERRLPAARREWQRAGGVVQTTAPVCIKPG